MKVRINLAIGAAVICATGFYCFLDASVASAQPVCDTVIKCAQVAVEAAQAAQRSAQNAIPAGAIMAFRLRDCPSGWALATDLAGRVIVGAGENGKDINNIPLTERKLGQLGGEEAHKLVVAEMPSHSHDQEAFEGDDASRTGRGDGIYRSSHRRTSSEGQDKAHNTMPPFFVLTYCEKK
jgi:microcystin-dependent protein